ncbi:MAG TPA: hypothetical protein VFB14_14125 [Bryobacteraceae bacterium]|nr:hypothetical protein [Bryobacteraceae bacterium]
MSTISCYKFGVKNHIKITRIPGKGGATCTATVKLQFDPTDRRAVRRFAKVLREIIPEEERAQFVADFEEAAAIAGFKTAVG